jgi:protein-disulfide isomerase
MAKLKVPVNAKDQKAGNGKAKIVLVEYGDYQCPHCGAAHPLLKRLLKEYGREFLFVFRNFPLQEAHPAAMMAALTAEASGLQAKFWEMHDLIFEHQDELDAADMTAFARALNLNEKKFSEDIQSGDIFQKVESDFAGGVRSGVNGTPTFYVNGNRLETYDGRYESLVEAVLAPH